MWNFSVLFESQIPNSTLRRRMFLLDKEEEHAEAEQEDGQDVQEDAGEAEASEEEGEV